MSLGTKGDNTVELDLGVVKGKDNAVEVNVPADSKDIDDVSLFCLPLFERC